MKIFKVEVTYKSEGYIMASDASEAYKVASRDYQVKKYLSADAETKDIEVNTDFSIKGADLDQLLLNYPLGLGEAIRKINNGVI